MMSSKIFLYFFTVLIIWSCCAASGDRDIRKKYLNFKGEVISYDDERHPEEICAKALEKGVWAYTDRRCSKNIICRVPGKDGLAIQLDEKPVTGVVCDFAWERWTRNYSACIDGECTFLQYEDEER